MRILIVEDDKKIASFVMKGLKQAGCVVDVASDGNSRRFGRQITAENAGITANHGGS